MANSSNGNSTSATEVTSWSAYSTSVAILAGLNIFLAITASLGNALILIALHKVTSIYPPTKLLFRCLAVNDLLVGLNTQPIYVKTLVSSITKSRADRIVALDQYRGFWSGLLPLVSVLTLSAISVHGQSSCPIIRAEIQTHCDLKARLRGHSRCMVTKCRNLHRGYNLC